MTVNMEKVADKLVAKGGVFTNEQLAKMGGFTPKTKVEERLISVESAKVRGAITAKLRSVERSFDERGGFENKYGKGRNNGEHRIALGDDYVRNQIAHNIKRLQQAVLETQYDNLNLLNDMESGADKKTADLLKFAKDQAEVVASAIVGQMDTGLKKLQAKHPQFTELENLSGQLEEFYHQAYETE